MIRLAAVAAVASLYFSPVTTRAQERICDLDATRSQVQFTLEASLHAVHGSFHVKQGQIAFDSAASGQVSGLISVDATSGDSGEASRDKKMTRDELKADKYSMVTFEPKKYTGQLAREGDSDIVVQGTFTLIGTPHEISVPMKVHMSEGRCSATGTFPVPFVSWGLKDPSTFLLKVGKQVTVTLDLSGKLLPAQSSR